MSLKVYNGIKFKSNDMQDIVKSLHSIRKQAIENSIEYAQGVKFLRLKNRTKIK